jgi:DNA-binding transcriptional LysR family regulator
VIGFIVLNPPSRKSLPPFEALRAFDAVARLGGVRKAAQSLCRDHAVISRHLRAIEVWTGATLIERTAAGVVLTEDGARYHRQIAAAMDAIAQATIDLMRRGQNHRLHIRCIPGFALHWLSGRLGDFEKANAGVDIELRPTDRTVTFSTQDCDVVIRLAPTYGAPFELAPGLQSAKLACAPIVAVANRTYLTQAAAIREPRNLLSHQLLHEENFDRWGNWLAAHGVYDDVYLTGPRLWQGHLTLDAARHGRGIALTNHLVAADDLASGRLVEVGRDLESFQPYTVGDYLFIARADRWDTSLIRRFRDWLTEAIARELPHLRPPAT